MNKVLSGKRFANVEEVKQKMAEALKNTQTNEFKTVLTYKGVPPKTQNLFIKTCVFILTCLNFSHLQSTLHLMQYTYGDIFSTAQNSF